MAGNDRVKRVEIPEPSVILKSGEDKEKRGYTRSQLPGDDVAEIAESLEEKAEALAKGGGPKVSAEGLLAHIRESEHQTETLKRIKVPLPRKLMEEVFRLSDQYSDGDIDRFVGGALRAFLDEFMSRDDPQLDEWQPRRILDDPVFTERADYTFDLPVVLHVKLHAMKLYNDTYISDFVFFSLLAAVSALPDTELDSLFDTRSSEQRSRPRGDP